MCTSQGPAVLGSWEQEMANTDVRDEEEGRTGGKKTSGKAAKIIRLEASQDSCGFSSEKRQNQKAPRRREQQQ